MGMCVSVSVCGSECGSVYEVGSMWRTQRTNTKVWLFLGGRKRT